MKISKGSLEYEILKSDKKTIVLVDLYHVSNKKYFKKLDYLLDSLANENYILLYEKIIDSTKTDLLDRKWKIFIGGISSESEYKAAFKNNTYFKVQNTDSIIQKFIISKNIDLSKSYIISEYEKIYGSINTTSKIDKETFNKLMFKEREENAVKKIVNETNGKMVVLFGSSHCNSISKLLLKNIDNLKVIEVIQE